MVDAYVTSAFCKNNRGGNKAGIVFNRPDLTEEQQMKIAKELGYSETAFLTDSKAADFKLQYFTPTEEVPLCGHATIAAFSTLNHLGRLNRQGYTIETKAGILHIRIKEDGLIFMEQNCPAYFDRLDADVFTNCINVDAINVKLPIRIVSTGMKDILLPIKSVEHLEQLAPDLKKMAELSRVHDVIGVHAFTITGEPDRTAVCRNFAPLYGIDEESATGTSNCALACYLFQYCEKKTHYVFEQGHGLGEVSQIVADLTCHEGGIDTVYVGGYGYLQGKKSIVV